MALKGYVIDGVTMGKDWILQTSEVRRSYSRAAWIPLRASMSDEQGIVTRVGYRSEYFGCGSVAVPKQHQEIAEMLSWSEIGPGHDVAPFAYSDGYYSPIEDYQYNDKEPIGVNLVFDHPQPVIGGRRWILSPDLIVALRLVKEGNYWVRPEEDFAVVVRERFDDKGDHCLIEMKKEFLLDYLAARGMSLRLSYYRQRIENVLRVEDSSYAGLQEFQEQREGGRYELRIRELNKVFGGEWAIFRAWRTDVDPEDDAPIMGPEIDENTAFEQKRGERGGYVGVRVEGEFWRDEWIEHQGKSTRVRGDKSQDLPSFIVDTDGSRVFSSDLNHEDIGRWLWFRPSLISELLTHRGFSLEFFTAETGAIYSTSGYSTHFGVNASDLVTVYAYDIARLPPWEQHVWVAHNVAPEGKVSSELLAAQVRAQPARTCAVETMLFETMRALERWFLQTYNAKLFRHDINDAEMLQHVNRFASRDRATLLKLAKELIRVFSDRIDVQSLRALSSHPEGSKLASNKLLQSIVAQKVGEDRAREVFAPIFGVYEMRIADAHPTGSGVNEALQLAGIDISASYLRQGEQLMRNFGCALWHIGKFLFGNHENQ